MRKIHSMETFRTNLESLVRNTSTLNSAAGPSESKGIQPQTICILGLTMSAMTAIKLKKCLRLPAKHVW